jgi:hypothetical protein
MCKCGDVEMWRCGDVEMWRCGDADVEMWRCGEMRKCEDILSSFIKFSNFQIFIFTHLHIYTSLIIKSKIICNQQLK